MKEYNDVLVRDFYKECLEYFSKDICYYGSRAEWLIQTPKGNKWVSGLCQLVELVHELEPRFKEIKEPITLFEFDSILVIGKELIMYDFFWFPKTLSDYESTQPRIDHLKALIKLREQRILKRNNNDKEMIKTISDLPEVQEYLKFKEYIGKTVLFMYDNSIKEGIIIGGQFKFICTTSSNDTSQICTIEYLKDDELEIIHLSLRDIFFSLEDILEHLSKNIKENN